MGSYKRFLASRTIIYLLEIFFGLTLCFIIPRLGPIDPILEIINRTAAMQEYIDPASAESLRESLMELYGLKGSLFEQYINYFGRLLKGDLGPSYSVFPTPVVDIINRALPWTLGILLWTTIIAWILGNLIGGVSGFYSDRKWAKGLAVFAVSVYPIPYYVMALILVIFFGYIFPIFPIGGAGLGGHFTLSLEAILIYLKHAFLPGLSLVVLGYGWWFISMRNLVINTKTEDYVTFGEAQGLSQNVLLLKYIMRNSLLPQVTGLAVFLGGIFSGALVTEVVFEYPGIGYVLYLATTRGDFNLMLGVLIYSVVAVATATFILDILYPLIDPRIRIGEIK